MAQEVIFKFDAEKDASAIRIFQMSHSLYGALYSYMQELDDISRDAAGGQRCEFAQEAKDNLIRVLADYGIEGEF